MSTVSAIIPTYNRAQLVDEAIHSVLEQSYKDIEIIVVDDGSTDNTPQVLGKFGGKIKVIKQANRGEGQARNAGINEAGSKYVAFLDSDDIWLPNKIERQMEILNQSTHLRWVYSDAYAFDHESEKRLFTFSKVARQHEGPIAGSLIFQDFIPSPTPVIKRSVFKEVGGFTDLPSAADWEMWLRIAARYPVGRIPDVLAGYRIHEGMITSEQDEYSKYLCRVEVVKRASVFAPDVYAILLDSTLAFQHLAMGRYYLGRENGSKAREMFSAAIRTYPIKIQAYILWMLSFLDQRSLTFLKAIYQNIGRAFRRIEY